MTFKYQKQIIRCRNLIRTDDEVCTATLVRDLMQLIGYEEEEGEEGNARMISGAHVFEQLKAEWSKFRMNQGRKPNHPVSIISLLFICFHFMKKDDELGERTEHVADREHMKNSENASKSSRFTILN